MAKLTDELSTGYRGQETQRAVDPGPSIWEGIAKTVSAAAGVVSEYKQTEDRNAATSARNAANAQKKSDDGAANFMAQGMLDLTRAAPETSPVDESVRAAEEAVSTTPPPTGDVATSANPSELDGIADLGLADPEAAAAGSIAAGQAKRLMTSVEQGRMTESAMSLRVQQLIIEGMTKFPDSKAVIWAEFRKEGVDHPLFAPYKRALASNDVVSKTETEDELKDARYYDENLSVGVDDPNIPMDQKVAVGRRMRARTNELERLAKADERSRAQSTFDAAQNETNRKNVTVSYVTAVETELGPALAENVQLLTTLSLSPGVSDADKFAALSNAINANRAGARLKIDNRIDEILSTSKGNVDRTVLEEMKQRLYKRADEALLPFDPSNPLNIIKQNATQMQMITAKTGLDMHLAAPMLMEFKRQFGNSESLTAFMETAFADPKISKLLAYEMKNFTGLADPDSKVHLMNAINMIKDRNVELRDLPAEQGSNALKNLSGYLTKAMPQAAASGSPSAMEDVLTGLGKVANVAVDLPVGSPLSTAGTALNLLANSSSATLLLKASKDPGIGTYAGTVADGVRAATQKGIIVAQAIRTGDVAYDVRFNKAQGRFEAVWNGKKTAVMGNKPNLAIGGEMGGVPQYGKPNSTAQTNTKVRILNSALTFMMKTGEFEDGMPIAKWTAPEQLKFYATGEKPRGAGKDGAATTKEPVVATMAKVERFWQDRLRDPLKEIKPVSFDEAAGARGVPGATPPANIAPIIKRAANAHGVPERLATALIGKESSFVVGNEGPVIKSGTHAGDRAMGLGQVMAKTAAAFGITDRSKLDAAGEADLSMRILKDNYDKTGNWKDAVSMYFTGVKYSTAVKQGRSDGFNSVMQYVEDIM